MHCQGLASTRLLCMGLASAKGQCSKLTANTILIYPRPSLFVYYDLSAAVATTTAD